MTRYIGKQPAFGNFVKLDAISAVNGQAAYTMQNGGSNFTNYDNVNQFIVSLNGIIQAPTDSFTVSGSTITFASNLATGDSIDFILVLGDVLSIGTPSDNTVSTAKIQNTAVNADKLATDAVQTAKIQDDAVTKAKVNFISDGTAGVEVKGDGGSNDGYIALNCRSNSHAIKLKSPPHSAAQSYTLTFPSTAPATDKILQTNSSGVLSFVDTPSGDMVKLASVSATGSASSITIDNVFTSDYDIYKFYYTRMNPASSIDHTQFRMRLLDSSGSAITSSDYQSGYLYYYFNSSSDTLSTERQWNSDFVKLHRDHIGQASDNNKSHDLEMTLFNPLSTSYKTSFEWNCNSDDGGGTSDYVNIGRGFSNASAQANRGIQFYTYDGDNIDANAKVICYGIKH